MFFPPRNLLYVVLCLNLQLDLRFKYIVSVGSDFECHGNRIRKSENVLSENFTRKFVSSTGFTTPLFNTFSSSSRCLAKISQFLVGDFLKYVLHQVFSA